MRLNEITKKEFLDKLKNPALAHVKGKFFAFKKSVAERGWNAELITRTDDSVIVRSYRFEGQTRVNEIKFRAYMYFVDSEVDNKYGIDVIDTIQQPDHYQMILGW